MVFANVKMVLREKNVKMKKKGLTKRDFETISVIGKGSYGTVTLVRKKDTRRLYALKALKKKHESSILRLFNQKKAKLNELGGSLN